MPPEAEAGDGGAEDIRTVILMRHGETDWNRQRRVMGTLDIPLNETGREQCARAAMLLADFGVTRVVTSPLERAADSASRIASRLGVMVDEDPDLEEVRFGHWQGLSYEEIVSHEDYRAFAADPTRNPTPGGETIVQVQGRGLEAVGRARPGERVVFVSHGDIIRAILSHYLAVPLDEFRRIRVDNCGLSAITSRRGRAEVKFVNLLADPDRVWEPLHWSRKVSAPTS